MNELKVFESTEFGKVRTIEINSVPYFVGKDVAEILGYAETANMRKLLEKEEYIEINPQSPDFKGFVQNGMTFEPNPNIFRMLLVNESGLYNAIFNSTLPKAKDFKRWVFDDVLPSIRKTGKYSITDKPDSYTISDPAERARRWIEEYEERKRLETKVETLTTTVSVQEQQINELQPKADYYNIVLNCKDLVSTTEIAKDYGKSAKWLNSMLQEMGVQFKQGGVWLLYQKYARKGYTSTKTHVVNGQDGLPHTKVHTYWTQKGRLFVYDMLKSRGILPVVEMTA